MAKGSCSKKFAKENVLEFIHENKQKLEPSGELIDSYFHQINQQERQIFPDEQISDETEI